MQTEYKPPAHREQDFHCPHCGVYAHQTFKTTSYPNATMSGHEASLCARCKQFALWVNGELVYPFTSIAPLPVETMPANAKADYQEARGLVSSSPRSAEAHGSSG